MVLLDRYILKQVLGSIALVLLVLGGLDLLFAVFEEAGNTNDFYGLGDAVTYVLLSFPRHIYDLLPMSCLIGALVGLGVLASSHELVVMQSAGVTVNRLVWSVMKPAAFIMVFALVLGEFIAPPLELRAEVGKALASGRDTLISYRGYWLKEGRQFLHVNAIDTDGVLHGVTLYEYDADKQPVGNVVAAHGVYLGIQQGSNRWRLEEVRTMRFSEEGEEGLSAQLSNLDSLDIELALDPELMEVLIMDVDNMAISDLYRYARYFDDQGRDSGAYFLSFWKKLLQPLTTAALVLVAISFIFGPLRNATMGSRLFTAICFGLFFLMVQRLLSTVSLVYQADPLVAVIIPIVLCAGAGLWLLKRVA